MRVISDGNVNKVIDSLNHEELTELQTVLEDALTSYYEDPSRIPERIVVPISESTHLFMPSFAKKAGIKSLCGSSKGYHGSVSIMNKEDGELIGVLNAFTLTAFRTALTSTIGLKKVIEKFSHARVSIYGNGLQAYWHAKLTLLLYPGLVRSIKFLVRSINSKSNELVDKIQAEFPEIKISIRLNSEFEDCDIIYGCIPSTEPNIKFQDLKSKPVFISLIGSYKPFMFECDSEIVEYCCDHGKILVDSKDHTLHEAGELIKSGIKKENCIELGELNKFQLEQISDNDSIYLCKIVGLSIMDVSMGTEILLKAAQKNLGVEVEF